MELIEGEPQKQVRYIPTQTFPPAQGLRADDLAGPRLVFCARVEMCDLHLHRLHLQVLRGDAGHLVSDLVTLDGDVLALDAETKARMSHAKAHRDTAVTKEQAFYTITHFFDNLLLLETNPVINKTEHFDFFFGLAQDFGHEDFSNSNNWF